MAASQFTIYIVIKSRLNARDRKGLGNTIGQCTTDMAEIQQVILSLFGRWTRHVEYEPKASLTLNEVMPKLVIWHERAADACACPIQVYLWWLESLPNILNAKKNVPSDFSCFRHNPFMACHWCNDERKVDEHFDVQLNMIYLISILLVWQTEMWNDSIQWRDIQWKKGSSPDPNPEKHQKCKI